MKVKHTITFEFEDEINFDDYDSFSTINEIKDYYSEWCLDDWYGRLEARAANILLSHL